MEDTVYSKFHGENWEHAVLKPWVPYFQTPLELNEPWFLAPAAANFPASMEVGPSEEATEPSRVSLKTFGHTNTLDKLKGEV